jgi:hypothetical protein
MENKRSFYIGILVICLCTLMYELTLTRIFSVLMWYHFASVAISLALFGLAVSGIAVYIFNKRFSKEKAERQLTLFSLLFSLSTFAFFLIFAMSKVSPFFMYKILAFFHQPFYQPFQQGSYSTSISAAMFIYLTVLYILTSLPFIFGGFVTTIALTHYSHKVNRIYFYDLVGAALGCIAIIVALSFVSGPSALLLVSLLGVGSAIFFSHAGGKKLHLKLLIVLGALFIICIGVDQYHDLTRINFVRGRFEFNMLSVKWNSFSRVAVYPTKSQELERSWGMSSKYKGNIPEQYGMVVDDTGYTIIYRYPEKEEDFEFFKYNVISLPYYLKEKPKTLIIGPGGGKDVLTALAFDSDDITAVEVNPLIVENVNEDFGSFSGYLYKRLEVKLFIDEGRSFVKRSMGKYDVIQASAVFENIAPSAGAFTLSENTIYTKEAFSDYLDHLTANGVLSISRFIFSNTTLRLASIAMKALEERGVKEPWRYILIYRERGVANFMMKKVPFTEEEISIIDSEAMAKGFDRVFVHGKKSVGIFEELINAPSIEKFYDDFKHDVSPTTDDKPFFYNMVKPKDFFNVFTFTDEKGFNDRGIILLRNLLYIVILLNLLFVVLPLLIFKAKEIRHMNLSVFNSLRVLVYFIMLGVGFMQIEIILLRRFTLLFGKPIYSLAVILFAILIFSGLGSYLSGRMVEKRDMAGRKRVLLGALTLIVLLSVIYTYALPSIILMAITNPVADKIIMSVLILAPLSLLMGCPLPLGVGILDKVEKRLIPWGWGLNGSASVLGSILAVAMSMNFGFTSTMLFGSACYAVAALCRPKA